MELKEFGEKLDRYCAGIETDCDACVIKKVYKENCMNLSLSNFVEHDKYIMAVNTTVDKWCEEHPVLLTEEEWTYLYQVIYNLDIKITGIYIINYCFLKDNTAMDVICIQTPTLEFPEYTIMLVPFRRGTRFTHIQRNRTYTLEELGLDVDVYPEGGVYQSSKD